ncbi:hypothetical protein N7603_00910 [Acholeplasma vituli]|uniref:Atrophied bacterial Ig domain-containing protein n=1 Tax=Paracholeplasma vituli TaxID=69473 RepID=A0ABT2PWV3_9MOLU|nr:immunoglobulin-like domain-containing protein [Paracholeplasma vituli]MCU0104222.1 hypothetical protein [Paracholeplasma vituli]
MKKSLKVFMLLLAIFSTALLAACTKEADTTLADAKAALAMTFQSGDSAASVTKDLTLPTSVGEVTIAWTSSAPAVIANDGKVTRPNADTVVTLTAKLTYKGNDDQRTFQVTVKAAVPTGPTEAEKAAAVAALRALYTATLEDVEYEVVADLNLVSTVDSNTVTWVSANTAVIANDGKVTRPAFNIDGGITVKLTATITVKGEAVEVEFFAFVKCLEKSLQQTLQEAVNMGAAFTSDIATVGITSNQTLNATVTYESVVYDIVWTSSNPAIIGNDGKVTRPAIGLDDAMVTLTATITKDGVSASKDVEFKVLSYKPSRAFNTIAEVYEGEGRAKDGEYIKVLGVKVLGKINDGIFVHDGTTVLYIYDSTKVIYNNLVIGNVYDIEGEFDIYFSSPQIRHASPNALTAVASTKEVGALTPQNKVYSELIDSLSLPTNPNELQFKFEYTRFTAKVIVDGQEGATSSYKYWLVPADYTKTTVIKTINGGKAIEYETKHVANIYYQSNDEAFASLNGKVVTINFLFYGYRSDRYVWYGNFFGSLEDIEIQFANDAEAMQAAKTNLEASIPTIVPAATTLTLPTALFGTTITWASNNEAVINPTTGVVTPVAGVQTSVTLTATINKGTETAVVVPIIVKVGEIPLSTLAQVVAAANSSTQLYKVQGVVTASEYYRTYFIQSGDVGIAVYTGDATMLATLKANIGKMVEVVGTRDTFNGLRQIKATEVKAISGTETITPVNADEVVLDATAMLPYQGRLVSMTGLKVTARTADSYNNVTLTLTQLSSNKTISMKWDSRTALSTEAAAVLAGLVVDKVVNITNVMAWNNNPYFYFTDSTAITEVAVTDQDKANAVAAALPKTITLSAAGAIELPATGADGTTIVYALKNAEDANKALIDLTAKTVTMPAEGQVTVVLVATVTLNDKTATAEISVKLGVAAETTVTASYTGATTNMTADNNATAIKLDPAIFNVVSTLRGVNPIHVGLNTSGQIRLYNSSDTVGNTLTISIASEYKITSVEFVFGATVSNALIMTGTTEQLNGALTASGTLTYSGLDVSQFSIQNKGTAQIYILSIKITYAAK